MRPLADTLRPTLLEDMIGQKHLIGKGKIIRNLIENKNIFDDTTWSMWNRKN